MRTLLTISINEVGQLESRINPENGDDPMLYGIALASATRVIAGAFMDIMSLDEGHREQIEAQIVESYNRDMRLGDMGEKETTKPL